MPTDDDLASSLAPGGSSWRRRVVERSLQDAAQRSVARGEELIFAAAVLLERSNGDDFTVQEVADLAKQSVRTVYVHFDGKDDLLLAVFEEAMQAYARVLEEAVAEYDDPLERLATAIYFGVRLAERATDGVSIGISKLRVRFAATKPAALASAQAPVTGVIAQLLEEAAAVGAIKLPKPEATTYIVRDLVDSVGASRILGNQYGLELPDAADIVEFALHGLHAELPDGWQARLDAHWDAMPELFSVARDLRVTRGRGGRR